MPALNHRGSRAARGRGFRSLPMWLQWVVAFGGAALVVAALVAFVDYQTNQVPQIATVSPKAAVETYREDRILVQQQQAPHLVHLGHGVAPLAGIRTAVVGYMSHLVNTGTIDGPITRSSCRALSSGDPRRQVFRCSVTASAQAVTYPFDGVVQPSTGQITFCQRIMPPVPSMNVPVSRHCR